MYSPIYSSQILKRRRARYISQKQVEKEAFILIGVNGVESSYRGFFEAPRLAVDWLTPFLTFKWFLISIQRVIHRHFRIQQFFEKELFWHNARKQLTL